MSTAIILFVVFFFAPWLWLDFGEDILESRFFKGRDDVNFQKIKPQCNKYVREIKGELLCDGSCTVVKWVPFGVKVDSCSEDYYFISFWGQRYYVNGE